LRYDFIIKNGTMINFHTNTLYKGNIYIKDEMIVEHDSSIPEETDNIIDASGKYVLPGLIDEHTHLNLYGSNIGANADILCIPSGVTTAVDAGTTGYANFELFYKSNIVRYTPDIKVYIHASSYGVKCGCLHEENHDPDDFCEDKILRLFKKYPDCIRGIKVRMCKATLENYGFKPLERVVEMASNINEAGYDCLVSMHYADLPDNVSVAQLAETLRPGDIFTHAFQAKGETILDKNKKVKESIKKARERGVIFDCCNGRGHWSFATLKDAFADGFFPDIISSDIIRESEYMRPGFSLLHAMCVLLAAGMNEIDILKAVTFTPAKVLNILDKAGTLDIGTPADMVVMDIIKTDQVFTDKFGGKEKSNKIFVPLLTMKNGRVAYRQIFF
jgi:dihydroorotase